MADDEVPLRLPECLRGLLHYDEEYSVIVCIGNGCRQAVSPPALNKHLRTKHSVSDNLRKEADGMAMRLPEHYEPMTVRRPDDGSWPRPVLPIHQVLRCRHCPVIMSRRENMKEHGNKAHHLQRVVDAELYEEIDAQTWFGGNRARYWQVHRGVQRIESVADEGGETPVEGTLAHRDSGEAPRESEDHAAGPDNDAADDAIAQEIEEWRASAQERRLELLAKVPPDEMEPWLRFTGWNEVLLRSKHSLKQTYKYRRGPDEDEVGLRRLSAVWDRVLNRCLDTLAETDADILLWLKSPKNEAAAKQPFRLPQDSTTLDRYSSRWRNFLCYAFRTVPEDDLEEETETGVWFTEVQRRSVQHMRQILAVDIPDQENEETEEGGRDGELMARLMRFCIQVIEQSLDREMMYRSPLMHYLAVMGIDVQTGTLRGSQHYTGYLAAAIWIIRLLSLERALPLRRWTMLGWPSKDSYRSARDRLLAVRKNHLVEASCSPASKILRQLAYGKAYTRQTPLPSNIHWSDDGETIYHLGKPVQLSKLRDFVQAVVRELRQALTDLAFGAALPAIDMSTIEDTMAWTTQYRQTGYSFIQHPDNGLKVGYHYLLRRAHQAPSDLRLLRAAIDGRKEWDDRVCRNYLEREKRFLQLLLVSMHVTAGQPGRGPEIGSVKIGNSVYSARNIYVLAGRVAYLTAYDKSRSTRDSPQFVVRYLPDEVGQLLVQYMAYVSPFARSLPMDRRESEYLFAGAGGPWVGRQASQALARASTQHLGLRLTLESYRHIAIGIGVRHLRQDVKALMVERDDEPESDEEEQPLVAGEILDRQAAHASRVARANYAIDGAFLSRLQPPLLAAYLSASVAWHELLRLASRDADKMRSESDVPLRGHRRDASQVLGSELEKRQRLEVGASREPRGGTDEQIDASIQLGLHRLYGDGAAPRSEEQRDALRLVLRTKQTSIVVMRTDGGKSVLFMVPAVLATHQTVIVVVPYVALVDDLVERSRRFGIDCHRWHVGHDEPTALVIVSADVAVGAPFLHYAQGLALAKQLQHVFFDECHVAYTDTSYRERLQHLWSLRYLPVPFTCLTATLLVKLEGTLRDRLLIPSAEMFRRPTDRRLIRYEVIDSRDKSPFVVVIAMVKARRFDVGQRGIIYVRGYRVGAMVAEELGCGFYKAMADEKSEVLEAWAKGDGGWIVATGALGTGIDIPGVMVVIHLDRPYGMTNFIQQSGRGGRGGRVSESIVVLRLSSTVPRRRPEVLAVDSVERLDEEALTEYLQSGDCRRGAIGRSMDGIDGVSCGTLQAVYCERCSGGVTVVVREAPSRVTSVDAGGSPEGVVAIEMRTREMGQHDEEVLEALRCLGRRCVYCEMLEVSAEGDEGRHEYQTCPTAANDELECSYEDFQGWRLQLRLPDYMHCFWCGLRQTICEVAEFGGACTYPDVMLPTLFVLHRHGMLVPALERQLGYRGQTEKDLMEWLAGVAEGFGEAETHASKAFGYFASIYWQVQQENIVE